MSQERYRFELLTDQHDISSFDCDATWLNIFLKMKALAETISDTSRTYVLVDDDLPSTQSVVGYFTLCADLLMYRDAEDKQAHLPIVELQYLARDKRVRGQGIGEILLLEVMRRIVEAAKWINIAAISLYATDEEKNFAKSSVLANTLTVIDLCCFP